jgi:hypothetical protein
MALIALLVDQVIVGSDRSGPERASAAPRPAVTPAKAPPPERAAAAPPRPQVPAAERPRRLGDRLEALARARRIDPFDVRDAFAPSDVWVDLSRQEPARKKLAKEERAEAFRREHRLTAVMLGGSSVSAVIDGKCLRIGEPLDGFRLVGVSVGSAVMEADGIRVELKLKTGSPPGAAE